MVVHGTIKINQTPIVDLLVARTARVEGEVEEKWGC